MHVLEGQVFELLHDRFFSGVVGTMLILMTISVVGGAIA